MFVYRQLMLEPAPGESKPKYSRYAHSADALQVVNLQPVSPLSYEFI